jgi:cytochrome P450
MKRVHGLIPAIEATTGALLDAVAGQTEFDLVAALAFPLPANIVFSLIGVPERDYAQLKEWCGYRAALSWGGRTQPIRSTSPGASPPTAAVPGQFDLSRPNADQHVAFGKGLHYCLGANLGKLEAQLAIGELARRYPELALVTGQRLTFHPNISFRGPQSLLVRCGQDRRVAPGRLSGRPGFAGGS